MTRWFSAASFREILVQIDQFLVFVVEEIDLGTGDAGAAAQVEESLALLGRAQVVAVFPDDHADPAVARIIGHLLQRGLRPARPETFQQVVLEAEFPGYPGPLLHALGRVVAAIEVTPERVAGPDPFGVQPLGKELRIGRVGDVVDEVAIDQRVQVGAGHHDPPGRGNRAADGGGLFEPLHVLRVAEPEGIAGRDGMAEAGVQGARAIGLQSHSAVVTQAALGDGGVAGALWQLVRDRRRHPFAGARARSPLRMCVPS